MKLDYRSIPKLDNTVWYFGCSITWGEHCEPEDSAPNQLAKLTGLEIDNLGLCGGGIELIHWQIQNLLKVYTPKMVIIQWPTDTRTFKIVRGDLINLGVWSTDFNSWAHQTHPKIVAEYQKELLSGHVQKKNRECKDKIIDIIKCPLIHFTYKEFLSSDQIDHATDGKHPGPKTHRRIAEILAQKINGGS